MLLLRSSAQRKYVSLSIYLSGMYLVIKAKLKVVLLIRKISHTPSHSSSSSII